MSDEFVRGLAKVVVAQICKQLGYQGIQQSACETLVDILQKYAEHLGEKSHAYAELACRTDVNFFDVRQALKDMNVQLDDIMQYAKLADEGTGFPFAVPEFPLKKKEPNQPTTHSNQLETNINSNPPYVGEFLPPFPEAHTYAETPLFPQQKVVASSDARQARKKKAKERKQVENSLAKLNEKLGGKPIANYDQARRIKNNPYFAPPEEPPAVPPATPAPDATPGMFSVKEEPSTAASVIPTPLSKDSPFVKHVLQFKPQVQQQLEAHSAEERRLYSTEMDEGERQKKKQRAEQILTMKLDTDSVDS